MLSTGHPDRHDTPREYRRTIRHRGECGPRTSCWRRQCRDAFPHYSTVEVLANGQILAHCHAGQYERDDLLARLGPA